MIGLKGGTPSTTQVAAPAAGGFFDKIGADFKGLGDRLSAPYNAMTDEQKKRYQKFAELAQYQPEQPQFSPVQFGGAGGGGGNLLSVIDLLKQRGY